MTKNALNPAQERIWAEKVSSLVLEKPDGTKIVIGEGQVEKKSRALKLRLKKKQDE